MAIRSHNPDTNPEVLRMERQLRCLREIALVFESTMDLDEILTRMVRQIDDLVDGERSTLYLTASDGGLVSRVIEGDEVAEIRLDPGQGIAGWVARTGHPIEVAEVARDDRFDPSWDELTGFTTRSAMCHPIRNPAGRIIGVIEVLNKVGEGAFDRADLQLLGLIASRLGLVLENSRLLVDLVEKNSTLVETKELLERSNRELALLLDLEQRVAHSDDLESLFISILRRVIDITHARMGILYRPDETGAELRVVMEGELVHRVIRVEHGTGISGWVAVKGEEVVLTAPTSDPRFAEKLVERIGVNPENLAAVPLHSREDAPPHGALLVANKKVGDSFEEADMGLLRLVAARLSQAIDDLSSREEHERERRLATVGRLLAGVLHDLRSPISVISGYAELLAAKAGGEEAEDYLGHLSTALARITTMTEEIIAFSRGEGQVLPGNVLVGDLIEQLSVELKPFLEQHGVELEQRIRVTGSARLDRDKLLRVFHNIARNAVEAMEEGGKLTVEVDQLGEEIVFSFTDTGPGVPDEIQGSLFQSFVTLGKQQGTGLGLSVAREIVAAHGGSISFSTVRDRGTTFLVSLPAQAGQ